MPEATEVAASETPAVTEQPVSTSTTPTQAAAPEVQGTEEEVFDKDRAMATIRKLREEVKQSGVTKKELETLRAERQQAEDAKLSEQDRLTKRTQQLEAEVAFERQEKRDRINHYEVQLAASRLGIVDPDAAVKLLDWSSLEYDTDGTPRDIDKALKLLVREKPYLAGAPSTPQTSATNGATRAQAPGSRIYSRADFNDYEFYSKHRADMQAAMREGRIVD